MTKKEIKLSRHQTFEGVHEKEKDIKNGRAPSGMIEELDLVDFLTTRDET